MHKMGLVATKPVFRVSDKVRFKPACSATETSWKIEISLVASLNMILSNKQITKALIRLRQCAGWSAPLLFANTRRQVFSHRGPYHSDASLKSHSGLDPRKPVFGVCEQHRRRPACASAQPDQRLCCLLIAKYKTLTRYNSNFNFLASLNRLV